jgi:hypothetical protein
VSGSGDDEEVVRSGRVDTGLIIVEREGETA